MTPRALAPARRRRLRPLGTTLTIDAERRLTECDEQAEQFTERVYACRGESCAPRAGRFRRRSTA
jgi:hypothetical protein